MNHSNSGSSDPRDFSRGNSSSPLDLRYKPYPLRNSPMLKQEALGYPSCRNLEGTKNASAPNDITLSVSANNRAHGKIQLNFVTSKNGSFPVAAPVVNPTPGTCSAPATTSYFQHGFLPAINPAEFQPTLASNAAYFTMSQHARTTNCTLSNIDPSFYSSSSSSLTAYSDKLRNSFICWASPDCDIISPASHPLPRHSPSVYNCDKLNQAAAASGGTDLNFGTNLRSTTEITGAQRSYHQSMTSISKSQLPQKNVTISNSNCGSSHDKSGPKMELPAKIFAPVFHVRSDRSKITATSSCSSISSTEHPIKTFCSSGIGKLENVESNPSMAFNGGCGSHISKKHTEIKFSGLPVVGNVCSQSISENKSLETSEPRDFSIASSFLFGNEEGMHWGGDCDQSNPTQPCAQQMPNSDSSSRNSKPQDRGDKPKEDLAVIIQILSRVLGQIDSVQNLLDPCSKCLLDWNVKLPIRFFLAYLNSKLALEKKSSQ